MLGILILHLLFLYLSLGIKKNRITMPAKSQLFLSNETVLRTLSHEVHECLTQNILPFWLNNMLDKKRGGWYGRMTGQGVTEKDAPRGAILYARLLWTFSAAYRVLGVKYERLAISIRRS